MTDHDPHGDDAPTLIETDSVALEMLCGDEDALRRRIRKAGAGVDEMRLSMQRMAEQRKAVVADCGEATVRLFAWPAIVNFGAEKRMVRSEARIFADGTPMAKRMRQTWEKMFYESDGVVAYPLERYVHLDAVKGVAPHEIHKCVFKGASAIEGTSVVPFSFEIPHTVGHETDDVRVVPVLLMAYVVTRAGAPEPKARTDGAGLAEAAALLRGMFTLGSTVPEVRMLRPQRFYAALEAAQCEQFSWIVEWAAMNAAFAEVSVNSGSEPEGDVEVLVTYRRPGESAAAQLIYTYDGTWRTSEELVRMRRFIGERERMARMNIDPRRPVGIGLRH